MKKTQERVMAYWETDIVPAVKSGKKPLIVGHRTCFGSIIQTLNNLSE